MGRMRGVLLGSIFLVAACTPVRKPPEMGLNDPNAIGDPSESTSSSKGSAKAEPAETWGSSETASSTRSGSTTTGSTDTASASTGTSAAASDQGPHVPSSVGRPSYDRAELEVILKRAARQVKSNCGGATNDDGVVAGPWGKTTITVKLGHNGHSKGGTMPAPYDGKPTGKCVVTAFTNLIYAPFAGEDADLDWPVEIVKP
jgi:hypothetical protein